MVDIFERRSQLSSALMKTSNVTTEKSLTPRDAKFASGTIKTVCVPKEHHLHDLLYLGSSNSITANTVRMFYII